MNADEHERYRFTYVSVGDAGLTARPAVYDTMLNQTVRIYRSHQVGEAKASVEKMNESYREYKEKSYVIRRLLRQRIPYTANSALMTDEGIVDSPDEKWAYGYRSGSEITQKMYNVDHDYHWMDES